MSTEKVNDQFILNALSLTAFVGIAAFSQWLHHRRSPQNNDNTLSFPLNVPDTVTKETRRGKQDTTTWEQLYRQRRRERLSFHEVSERENSDYWTDSDGSSTSSSEDVPNHPFQSNWSHFEKYNQEESLTVVSGTSSRKPYSKQAQRRLFRTVSGSYDEIEELGGSLDGDHPLLPVKPSATTQPYQQRDNLLPQHPPMARSSSLPTPPSSSVRRSDTLSTTEIRHSRHGSHHSIQLQNRAARTQYNAQIMPQKLILLRHGQSMGNIDEQFYSTTPDNAMPLTELGWEQARTAGKHLKEQLLGDANNVHFIISPYVRTVETFHGIVSAWCDPEKEFGHIVDRKARLKAWYSRLLELGLSWREDPRIREQDFGNYQKPSVVDQCKKERAQFGAFYFRFPNGESGADVFDRISTFLDSLWRSFDIHKSRHYVLITHGIAIRVLLTRYYRYTIDQFHLLANPKNCEMVVLEHDQRGRLILSGRHELTKRNEDDEEKLGYDFYPRLRVLPDELVRTAKCRMTFKDQL
jgi:broad specificity phosphatase PhoE